MKSKIMSLFMFMLVLISVPVYSDDANAATLPKKYDSRDYGYVTPVKDQYDSQWCWAYSAASAMETSLIKNKIVVNGKVAKKNNIDISEAALAYCFYNQGNVTDPMKNTIGDSTNYFGIYSTKVTDYRYFTGNVSLVARFLSNNMGIKNDSFFTLDDAFNNKIPSMKNAYKSNIASFKNSVLITSGTNGIKSAIKKYGSVIASYYNDYAYFNYDTNAYCCPYYNDFNHTITIVGWNDNYSYKNFSKESNIKKNGAWIVKNSWGDHWGDNGYFYISYYDQTLTEVVALEMQSATAFDNNYFYDGSMGFAYWYNESGSKFANVFKASGKQELSQVSFDIRSENVKYSVQIYKNLKKSSNPTSGTPVLKHQIKGTAKREGMYTVDIPKRVSLSKGEKFSVVITLTSSDNSQVNMGCEMDADYGWVSCKASTKKNQSFTKSPYGSWYDISPYDNCCLRIKAHTLNPIKVATVKNTSAKLSKNSIKVNYDKISGAKYEIKYSTSKSMKNYKKITTSLTSKSIKNIKSGKTYYIKVRAYKTDRFGKKVYGEYSTVKKVTTKK